MLFTYFTACFFPASQAIVASRDRFSHAFNPGVVRWVRRAQKPAHLLHSNDVVVIQQAEVEPFVMMLNRVSCLSPNDGPSLPPQVMQVLAWVVSTVLLKFLLSTVLCASDDVRVRTDSLEVGRCLNRADEDLSSVPSCRTLNHLFTCT